MARICMVIAHSDESYVEGLDRYLKDSHSQKFEVSYFTREDYLVNHLSETKKNVDILLIGTELYGESLPLNKVNTTIILSDGRQMEKCKGCPTVNKYQTGDKLVAGLLNIFSERSTEELYIQNKNKQAKVVGVYSPAGGVGKTCIAVGTALQCALRGMSVFYLNLENVQSTPLFFDCNREENLSHIFYYLKEKNKNLNLKIEGIKTVDLHHKIHYFAPPESMLEFEEILPEELHYLINQLKELNSYDIIFVDMSSCLNNRNLSILQACDEILLVLTQNGISGIKLKALMNEMDIGFQKSNLNLAEKLTLIINKFNSSRSSRVESVDFEGKYPLLRIPEVPYLLTYQADRCILNLNNNFGEALKELVNRY